MNAVRGHNLFGGDGLKKFDVFQKVSEDFFTRTNSGGLITIGASMIMFILFISELRLMLTVNVDSEIVVDTAANEKFVITINIDLYHLACPIVSLDAMDMSGENQLDVSHTIYKRRINGDGIPIDPIGSVPNIGHVGHKPNHKAINMTAINQMREDQNYCGSCYGALPEEACCNSCEDVRNAYKGKGWNFNPAVLQQCIDEGKQELIAAKSGEGCNIFGTLEVNKVSGNIHFAPGHSYQEGNAHVHDLTPFHDLNFNTSHKIHHLAFGYEIPGIVNPLDDFKWINDTSMQFQYYIKVVPTSYYHLNGKVIMTNQFASTKNSQPVNQINGRNLPGVFLYFDVLPMKVMFKEKRLGFLQFLTSVCAIAGGVFTVSGIVDTLLYKAMALTKKVELGKVF